LVVGAVVAVVAGGSVVVAPVGPGLAPTTGLPPGFPDVIEGVLAAADAGPDAWAAPLAVPDGAVLPTAPTTPVVAGAAELVACDTAEGAVPSALWTLTVLDALDALGAAVLGRKADPAPTPTPTSTRPAAA
jgi:hypothetical protein